MPTPEEIKSLCAEYAQNVKSEYVSAKLIETLVMGFYHSRLKTDYCIVPKSQIKEWYNSAKGTSDYFPNAPKVSPLNKAKSLIEIFERLFGKSLFNEEKE